jgi:hypothetical protein
MCHLSGATDEMVALAVESEFDRSNPNVDRFHGNVCFMCIHAMTKKRPKKAFKASYNSDCERCGIKGQPVVFTGFYGHEVQINKSEVRNK